MHIDIYDTGSGMSADQLPRIFEAFQRLDSTRPDGLGLGLFVDMGRSAARASSWGRKIPSGSTITAESALEAAVRRW
jgi:K+-sensing histidine kinase KdpD